MSSFYSASSLKNKLSVNRNIIIISSGFKNATGLKRKQRHFSPPYGTKEGTGKPPLQRLQAFYPQDEQVQQKAQSAGSENGNRNRHDRRQTRAKEVANGMEQTRRRWKVRSCAPYSPAERAEKRGSEHDADTPAARPISRHAANTVPNWSTLSGR
jgi:hypothetical protein